MKEQAPNNNNKTIGAIILVGMIGAIVWLGGFRFLTVSTIFVITGLFGIFLYSVKANNWATFILKVISNILFNPFYLILLLKSWTMLGYKDQLEELDRKQREIKKI